MQSDTKIVRVVSMNEFVTEKMNIQHDRAMHAHNGKYMYERFHIAENNIIYVHIYVCNSLS